MRLSVSLIIMTILSLSLASEADSPVKKYELDAKINASVERLEHKMLQLEYRLVIKLGTIVTIVIAAATTVIKFL